MQQAATTRGRKHCQIVLCAVVSVASASAQLALNRSDVWAYSFDELPFVGEYKIFPEDLREAVFSFTIAPGSFEAGSLLNFEVFEGAPVGAPRASGSVAVEPAQPITVHSSFTWQDVAGSVKFTMVTGSCVVANVELGARVPNSPTYFNVYSTNFTPVPLAPRLAVLRQSNAVQVSWWTNGASGFVLEATNVLQAGEWPTALHAPIIIDRRFVVTVDLEAEGYFRLRK